MKPFTFIVSTQQDPPLKGSNIQAINAHCASFAHKRRNSKGQFSSLSNPQAARRILVQKVDPSPDITTCTDFTKKKSPIKDEKESSNSKNDQLRNHSKTLDVQQQKCTVCIQNDYSICLCAHTHDFDAQLLSILDPFTIIPLKLSRHEQIILQEYLTNNKMLVYGTAVGPQQICFTRAYSRTNIPWASKLHLLAHVIIAEAPMVKENEAPSTFYLRRAQIYEAMNEHLSDDKIPFREKIISFLTLSLIETSLSMLDLRAKHVNALHNFIKESGGMRRALSEFCPANLADDLPGILIQHLSENVPITEISTLEESISCMTQALRDTATWASNTMFPEDSKVKVALHSQTGQKPLPRFRKYLAFLANFLKHEDLDSRVPQGIFHCVFGNILLHQVIYNFDAPTSLRFLESLEECMVANNASRQCEVLFSNIFWVRGASPSSLLNSAHSKIGQPVKEKEIRVLEGTYAMLRLVALLSPPVRAKLAQSIHKCIFTAIKPARANVMSESFLKTIAEDIRKNWSAERVISTDLQHLEPT